MVSLEGRISYLNRISQIPKIKLFFGLLSNKVEYVESYSGDTAYIDFIECFINNDSQAFQKLYIEYTRKKPSSESLWINDDFLIFILLLGIVRYNIERNWIKEALTYRVTQKTDQLSINKSFVNILNDNYQSKDNLHEIIIVFQFLLNQPLSVEHFNPVYEKISSNHHLFESQNDFLICITLKVYDIIILSKNISNADEISMLRAFHLTFYKRALIISKVLYFLLLSLIIILVLIYWNQYNELLNGASILFGLFGFGLLTFISWVQKKILSVILRLFNYK